MLVRVCVCVCVCVCEREREREREREHAWRPEAAAKQAMVKKVQGNPQPCEKMQLLSGQLPPTPTKLWGFGY